MTSSDQNGKLLWIGLSGVYDYDYHYMSRHLKWHRSTAAALRIWLRIELRIELMMPYITPQKEQYAKYRYTTTRHIFICIYWTSLCSPYFVWLVLLLLLYRLAFLHAHTPCSEASCLSQSDVRITHETQNKTPNTKGTATTTKTKTKTRDVQTDECRSNVATTSSLICSDLIWFDLIWFDLI